MNSDDWNPDSNLDSSVMSQLPRTPPLSAPTNPISRSTSLSHGSSLRFAKHHFEEDDPETSTEILALHEAARSTANSSRASSRNSSRPTSEYFGSPQLERSAQWCVHLPGRK